jgi:hypothetical protein
MTTPEAERAELPTDPPLLIYYLGQLDRLRAAIQWANVRWAVSVLNGLRRDGHKDLADLAVRRLVESILRPTTTPRTIDVVTRVVSQYIESGEDHEPARTESQRDAN